MKTRLIQSVTGGILLIAALHAIGQTSVQNFGTGTGTLTSQTGTALLIPNPTSGLTWARAGATAPNAPIVLANTANPLGTTGSYVRGVASSSASVSKFSPMVGYAVGTQFYTSFKVLFGDSSGGTTASSGTWAFYQGAGTMYSDASDFTGSQVFSGLRFAFGASGAITLNYRSGSSWSATGLTTSSLSQGTVYTIEIVGNNSASTVSYTYYGNAQTVAPQKFDLYVNGTLVGNDLAEAALIANGNVSAAAFIGTSSTGNVANIFVDDVVVYNSVPSAIGASSPGVTASTSSSIGTTTATLGATVNSDGGASISDYGIVWGTSANPTTSNNKVQKGTASTPPETFTVGATALPINTLIYYRGYAINSVGTGYSSDGTFWTLAATPAAPTVGSPTATTLNVAIGSGDGNPATTAYAIHLVSPDQYVQADGTLGASAVYQTAAVWGTKTVTGLTASTLYTFEVKARNGNNVETGFGSQAAASTASGGCPTITLTAPPLAAATVGSSYSQTIAASGSSSTPYTYSLTGGSLPAGLTLSSGGVISGTPTSSASATFTVTATDSSSCTGSQEYTITPGCPTITLTTSDPLPAGTVATAYSQQLAASGGNNSFTFAKTSGNLPGGLTLSTSGLLSGTPTASGSFTFGVTATDSSGCSGSGTYHVTIGCTTITMTTPDALPVGVAGHAYSQQFAASGGNNSFTFALASGTLPAGLTLSASGLLSGTNAAVGAFTFEITATDTSGCSSAAAAYNITNTCGTIFLSPSTLPNASTASAYSQALTASSGVGPYTYLVTAGALPGGMNLSSAGVISGTPSAAGTFNFDVTVTDSTTGCYSVRSYTLTVTLPPVVGWDVSTLTGGTGNWGPSPLAPSTTAANVTVVGLTRGAGVITSPTGSAAARAWGGTAWTSPDAATAITEGKYVTFTVKANTGYLLSLSGISKFDYRRSTSGAPSGTIQYSTDGSTFNTIAGCSYTATSSSGGSIAAVDLSGIPALQNVPASTTITFRIVNYGASGGTGTWYIFDVANNTANDFEIVGAVVANQPPVTQNTSYTRASGLSLKIPVADILALCSDPENNTPITLQSVTSGSLGATVTKDSTFIYYAPGTDGTDTLVYTVADSLGATATGNISIGTTQAVGQNATATIVGGNVVIRFAGIPGFTYDVQRSTDGGFTSPTVPLTTNAPAAGVFYYSEPNSGTAFFRLKAH